GVTLFVTTHYMDEAERCTDVGYICNSRLIVCGKPEQLKSLPDVTPAGTARWEFEVAHPAAYLQSLRSLTGVHDATLFGQTIHVLANHATSPAKMVDALALNSQDVQYRSITPSLEDVFVTLSRSAERGDLSETQLVENTPPTAELVPPQTENAGDDFSRSVIREASRKAGLFSGFVAIFLKEFSHIRREPATLFFTLIVPVLQTIVFGIAVNTEIEDIPMVIFDLDGRSDARELRESFENTHTFRIVERVLDEQSFDRAITSGRAKVGVRIPADYSDRLLSGRQAHVQVLIDGSDSQVATTAMNTANLLGLKMSIGRAKAMAENLPVVPARDEAGATALPIEMRTRLLFNPNLESSHFFVPGLVGIIMQLVTLFLTTFAIPVTYYIEILRAIVLRGADFFDVLPSVLGLAASTIVVLAFSLMRFRKQLV
ncbi:MAG: ABC transporter permease, partial [Fuerstia sp.]|nr:ABC transporter permease [Fuerstiella sp.]